MAKERYPIADLRRDMAIRLTVMPRHVFKALWDKKIGDKDSLRDRLVAELTRGWEAFEIMHPGPRQGHTAGSPANNQSDGDR